MDRVDYDRYDTYADIEEKLLRLVQSGNRDAFPFWMRLITTDDPQEKAQIVHELFAHIEQRRRELDDLLGGR